MRLPGNLGEMLAQAQKIQQTVVEVQAELAHRRIEGNAGGGMVVATIDGAMHVISINIDPSLLASGDVGMLQDLVCAALNDALGKAKEAIKTEFGKFTGGIPIPGLS
jgi:nucleoid-associated protein EbfC